MDNKALEALLKEMKQSGNVNIASGGVDYDIGNRTLYFADKLEKIIKQSLQLTTNKDYQSMDKESLIKLLELKDEYILQQPNKEQLRDEIISELNEYYESNFTYSKNSNIFFTNTLSLHIVIQCINGNINFYKKSKVLSVIELDLPLSLASKIIKYFELEESKK